MVRASISLEIVEGGTCNNTYLWKSGDPALPVDLTGYTGHMQIRKRVGSDTVILEVDFQAAAWAADGDTGIYIYDQTTPADVGKYRIYLKDDDTEGLCTNHKDIQAVYDLFLYNASNESVLQQYGVAAIVASVTRIDVP